MLQRHAEAMEEAKLKTEYVALTFKRTQIVQAQREERAQFAEAHQARFDQETRDRASACAAACAGYGLAGRSALGGDAAEQA